MAVKKYAIVILFNRLLQINSCNRNRNCEPLKSSHSQAITFHM